MVNRVALVGNVALILGVLWAAHHTYPTSPLASLMFVLMGGVFLSRIIRARRRS